MSSGTVISAQTGKREMERTALQTTGVRQREIETSLIHSVILLRQCKGLLKAGDAAFSIDSLL